MSDEQQANWNAEADAQAKAECEQAEAESELAAPAGSAACGTIAMLRLPISVRNLKLTTEILRKLYGEGLTMQENPKGWLDIRSPKPPNS